MIDGENKDQTDNGKMLQDKNMQRILVTVVVVEDMTKIKTFD